MFFGCTGSLLLQEGFSLVAASRLLIAIVFLTWSTGSVLTGFSTCGTEAQYLWLPDPRQAQ